MVVLRSISMLNTWKTCSYSPKMLSLFANTHSDSVLLKTLSFSYLSNSRSLRTRKIRSFGTTSAAVARNGSDAETFLAEESVSWASLGVPDTLSRALSTIGLHRPSLVQASCIPTILAGSDVVVAAETGSGKTHGYLVPLVHKLCSSLNVSETDNKEPSKHQHISLVLCPNVMLCEQVVRMANSLCNDSGEPLLRAAAICGRQGLLVKEPEIIVSTPVALLNYLYAIDVDRHKRANLIRSVKYVVFDEADLLLCGSFQNQVIRLIDMLRFDEKQFSRLKSEGYGAQDAASVSLEACDIEDEEDIQTDLDLEEDEDTDQRSVVQDSETPSEVTNRRDWRRVRKVYERSKQYIFVAATLPVNGKKTAGGTLKRIFPDANWVSGNYLHCQNPRLEQKWVEVTADTQVDALINAINNGRNANASGIVRTMVFANTVEAAEAVAKILMGAGIGCLRYHSDISLEERTENLVDFQEKGGVFVCTDAAARGLDIPNISHVIQAEFASCAVDFLHRVGRTARAGQNGLVTSLFTASNRDLVAAVRQAEDTGLPVENAFSRKRGFRNKIKKRGLSRRNDASLSSVRQQVPT
ncbi:hypothetical protein RD792_012784 [Penstemon davidsonii]|uniref:RNA helicase n=1 Tax=Penstemon davidsonii TaxID=160366 RepID=A0ABR0CZB5_9LAMI|nr:hypothetical protein RD792_012784 [Penstemon davidsonii]